MGLLRTSLFVVVSCAVMSVQAANFNKAKDVKTKDTKYGEVYQYSGSWEIPEKPPKKPNKATLQAYLDKYIYIKPPTAWHLKLIHPETLRY